MRSRWQHSNTVCQAEALALQPLPSIQGLACKQESMSLPAKRGCLQAEAVVLQASARFSKLPAQMS